MIVLVVLLALHHKMNINLGEEGVHTLFFEVIVRVESKAPPGVSLGTFVDTGQWLLRGLGDPLCDTTLGFHGQPRLLQEIDCVHLGKIDVEMETRGEGGVRRCNQANE